VLCRGTDPLGGAVTTWHRQVFQGQLLGTGWRPDGSSGTLPAARRGVSGALVLGGDHWLPDPQRGPVAGRRWRPGVCAHADYVSDPEWDRAVALAAGLVENPLAQWWERTRRLPQAPADEALETPEAQPRRLRPTSDGALSAGRRTPPTGLDAPARARIDARPAAAPAPVRSADGQVSPAGHHRSPADSLPPVTPLQPRQGAPTGRTPARSAADLRAWAHGSNRARPVTGHAEPSWPTQQPSAALPPWHAHHDGHQR
jgi:hypothetical protein